VDQKLPKIESHGFNGFTTTTTTIITNLIQELVLSLVQTCSNLDKEGEVYDAIVVFFLTF